MEPIATIDKEIESIRKKELELLSKRDYLLIKEAEKEVRASIPSVATQIAKALIAVNTQNENCLSLEYLFWMQSPDVITAGLLEMAQWRDAKTIEMFLNNGADVNGEDDQGFSVLEAVIQGHDGYWRGDSCHWNEEVFKVLDKYHVRTEISHGWIIDQCCDGAPKYVRDFLGLDDDANEDAVDREYESRRVV
jgi:hypothetical protein